MLIGEAHEAQFVGHQKKIEKRSKAILSSALMFGQSKKFLSRKRMLCIIHRQISFLGARR